MSNNVYLFSSLLFPFLCSHRFIHRFPKAVLRSACLRRSLLHSSLFPTYCLYFFTPLSNYCTLVFYKGTSESYILLVLQMTVIYFIFEKKKLRNAHGSYERKTMFYITLDVDSPLLQIWRLYLDHEYKLDIIGCKLFHIYVPIIFSRRMELLKYSNVLTICFCKVNTHSNTHTHTCKQESIIAICLLLLIKKLTDIIY